MNIHNDKLDALIALKMERGEFIAALSLIQAGHSGVQHDEFIKHLSEIAKFVRALFLDNGLIKSASEVRQDFWNSIKGKTIGFVDGGVASLDIPSAAPVGIRVGTYKVKVGDRTDQREQFDFMTTIVDELYGADARTYIDSYEDIQKLADAARIISEVSGAVKLSETDDPPDLIMLHGPLINPVAPYGPPGFPSYTERQAKELHPTSKTDYSDQNNAHFVNLYRELVEHFDSTKCPCIGVIERSATRTPQVVTAHLQSLVPKAQLNDLIDKFELYHLTDTMLLSLILMENEWVEPVKINVQLPDNKWPDQWRSEIRKYPSVLTSYVKTSADSDPFRIQLSENQDFQQWHGDLLVNTSILLPNYSFPVGLDIVDKHAKVPSWMSKSIRGQHATALMMRALETGDPEAISYAKRIMAAKGRDWMFRPGA